MKRKFLILGVMLSCLLGLSACGASNEDTVENSYRYPEKIFNQNALEKQAVKIEDQIFEYWFAEGVTPENFDERQFMFLAMDFDAEMSSIDRVDEEYYNAVKSGYTSWYNSLEELGFTNTDSLAEEISVVDVKYYFNDDDVLVLDVTLKGTKHEALMQIYLNNDFRIRDMGVTVDKTLGEKLTNAGLNTLLGMGMAFAILIAISIIISFFPVFFGDKKKKKESDKDIATKAMDNTINQIAEQEDLSGDSELVAVIAAAIAAYEGSGSTDGFRVRSIRKVNNVWKKF
ncbi:MAG: OadG family protein [Butyrivibrio sp.]|nr:OadG family protein [Butyrivibrio sp.]